MNTNKQLGFDVKMTLFLQPHPARAPKIVNSDSPLLKERGCRVNKQQQSKGWGFV
jgi:hypothetical protein